MGHHTCREPNTASLATVEFIPFTHTAVIT
jgi:hypothetical protein